MGRGGGEVKGWVNWLRRLGEEEDREDEWRNSRRVVM